ncbi:DNA repair family protein-like protein [Pestalotiopsis sp. NC0098]|nr:DNA repair family protein-like protein [Pestalotiopsis sp. NC0098]
MSARKRTIDAFFGVPKSSAHEIVKKPRASPKVAPSFGSKGDQVEDPGGDEVVEYSKHPTYPFPIAHLPTSLASELPSLPSSIGKPMTDQPDLDLLYFEPYLPRSSARELFEFLRSSLPFYRVEYDIKRGGISTHIRTPRWTTVFGLDETSRFSPVTDAEDGATDIVDAQTGRKVVGDRYYARYAPRPIPACLDALRRSCEAAAGCAFNFCLVNYYAGGADSISYHSDDERFLGPDPAIASFSLGARRDFYMKHKPPAKTQQGTTASSAPAEVKPLKLPLGSGDMILMRGSTQANWLHSIPKRSGKNAEDGGRINITFRRAMVKSGTENYYNFNVGTGPVYRWDAVNREMRQWEKPSS